MGTPSPIVIGARKVRGLGIKPASDSLMWWRIIGLMGSILLGL